MAKQQNGIPNPRRVEAGRRNQQKWKGLTDAGRVRLRVAALKHQPWLHSTGPRTPEGKAKVAMNGRSRQLDAVSRREVHRELAPFDDVLARLAEIRQQVLNIGRSSAAR